MLILYWSKQRNKFNYGDELSLFIVSKLAREEVVSLWPYSNNSKNFLRRCVSFLRLLYINGVEITTLNLVRSRMVHVVGLGSIINRATSRSLVWGSGIIAADDKINPNIEAFVVRGPLTLDRLNQMGIKNKGALGDPALLLPNIIPDHNLKSFEIGVIPHVNDYELVAINYKIPEGVALIDLSDKNLEEVTAKICSCKKIISSSLHGIIVANAYGIPTIRAEFTNNLSGDGTKFLDYMLSVGATRQEAERYYSIRTQSELNGILKETAYFIPAEGIIEKRKYELISNAPFEVRKEYV